MQLRDLWENILQETKVVAEAIGVTSHFQTFQNNRWPLSSSKTEFTSAGEMIENKQHWDAISNFKYSVIFPVLDIISVDLKTIFTAAE